MPESAEEFHARIGSDPLPLPDVVSWDPFPFEGDLRVRPLRAPAPEQPRAGEHGNACWRCDNPEANVVWRDEHWTLAPVPPASGLPLVMMLETREHMDFGHMNDELASEFGRICARIVRIVEGMPHIVRCHLGRWGDGSAHHHVWFFGRPEGFGQLRGSFATVWDDILPPGPDDVRRADLAHVARRLAHHGGQALV